METSGNEGREFVQADDACPPCLTVHTTSALLPSLRQRAEGAFRVSGSLARAWAPGPRPEARGRRMSRAKRRGPPRPCDVSRRSGRFPLCRARLRVVVAGAEVSRRAGVFTLCAALVLPARHQSRPQAVPCARAGRLARPLARASFGAGPPWAGHPGLGWPDWRGQADPCAIPAHVCPAAGLGGLVQLGWAG